MEKVSLNDLAASVKGKARDFGESWFAGISTDSRTVRPDEVFFALVGERLDGHDYVAAALERGAMAAVVSQQRPEWDAERLIVVPDTTAALLDFAGWYRSRFDVRMVAVTGSVGKTTTKEMIAAVLSADGRTHKTEGNQNNQIGLPKTLLSLSSEDKYAVVEMGMTGLHEIDCLSLAAKPSVGVITNIGVSHLENLHTRENILCAKLEICEGIADGGTLILNIDNDLLSQVKVPRLKIMTIALHDPDADVRCTEYREEQTGTKLTILYHGSEYQAEIPCIGEHNVYNALAAFAVGVTLGIAPEKMLPALPHYRPAGMRQKLVQFRDMLVIEDCYNAAPDSMRAAMSTLSRLPSGRRIAVLADMLELGSVSDETHTALGALAASSRVDLLLCYGSQTRLTVEAARKAGLKEAHHFDDKSALTDYLIAHAQKGDTVLVKGSRSMALEDVLHGFYAQK